jgi:hypothetical protein
VTAKIATLTSAIEAIQNQQAVVEAQVQAHLARVRAHLGQAADRLMGDGASRSVEDGRCVKRSPDRWCSRPR